MRKTDNNSHDMRRRLIVWGTLLLMSLNINAEWVSEQEAAGRARRFFARQEQSGTRHSAKAREVEVERVKLKAEQQHRIAPRQDVGIPGANTQDAFYIFNRTDGQGFVIISAESETSEVLAYSEEGTFHPESIEQGAERFLQFYADEIGKIRSGEAHGTRHDIRKTNKQLLLKTVNLNQNKIYFNAKYAPEYNGRLCLAGCGPVAMATVMAYHKWPETAGVGSESYTTSTNGIELTCDFEAEEPINWSLIKSGVVSAGKASDECSRLLYQCGVAMHANYDPSFTEAYVAAIVYALREVFCYDACTMVGRVAFADEDEWDDVMYNELDNNRPVIVCAQGGLNDWDRHIFVVDGYNTTGFYHYNLGWGGQNNGYYRDGKISSSNLYLCDGIVYGTKPLREERPKSCCLVMKNLRMCEWENNNGEWNPIALEEGIGNRRKFDIVAYALQNCYHKTINGQLRAELHRQDGTLKSTISSNVNLGDLQSYYYYYWFYISCEIPATIKVLPTDYVSFSFRQSGTSKWLPIYCIDDLTSYVHVDRDLALPILAPTDQPANTLRTSYYDLQGRKLSQPTGKGLYIKDGKVRVKN